MVAFLAVDIPISFGISEPALEAEESWKSKVTTSESLTVNT